MEVYLVRYTQQQKAVAHCFLWPSQLDKIPNLICDQIESGRIFLNCGPQSINWTSTKPLNCGKVTTIDTLYYNFAPIFTSSKIEVFSDLKYQIGRTYQTAKLLELF